jgi:hypothetical protein
MKVVHLKMAFAAVWALSAAIVAMPVGSAGASLIVDRIALALFAVMPPLTLWFWWHEPSQTMSERIHEARNDGSQTRRRLRGRD